VGALREGLQNTPPVKKGAFIRWRPRPIHILGVALSLLFIFSFGTKALLSYTDRPEFCISCHVMEKEYESWFHSAHHMQAKCGDCHVPQQNLAVKLAGKGIDGTWDFYRFHTNQVPDPIRISERGSKTVRENCLRCHSNMMEKVNHDSRNCWECHRSVSHI